jgi:AcrR family transcriptional regulator
MSKVPSGGFEDNFGNSATNGAEESGDAPQRRGGRRTATLAPPAAPTVAVSQDTAAAIVEAAARCFARWGIARTRVEDIASEVGIARPHIYRHFASKDAIIHGVVLRQIRRHHRRLAERFPHRGPASELIVGSLLSGIRDTADNPETAFLVDSEASSLTARSLTTSPEVLAELRTHWIPLLQYARERGELRDELDLEKAARWLVFVQFSYLALPEMVSSPADLAAELRAFVLPALLAEPRGGS